MNWLGQVSNKPLLIRQTNIVREMTLGETTLGHSLRCGVVMAERIRI